MSTIGAPFTHYTSPYAYTTTLDNYYFWVDYSPSYSTFTASDGSDTYVGSLTTADGLDSSTMWTACNDGTIEGTFSSASSGTTSRFCAYGGYDCFTYIIQSRFGDTTDRLTSLECRTSYSTLSSETIIYREEPAKSKLALPFRSLFLTLRSLHRSGSADMNHNSWSDICNRIQHQRRPRQYPPLRLRQSWVHPNEHPFPNFLSKYLTQREPTTLQ